MVVFFRRYSSFFLLTAIFFLFLVLSHISDGYYGGFDNISHFYIARYAFHYPHLFIDPQGIPLYTILSSPFALLGFQGIKIFNILMGTMTAFLAWRIARKINIRPAMMAIFFVYFMPLYTVMLLTALPEILSGFLLISSIYLFLDKKYTFSAIVISFLVFACPEGIILLMCFAAALLWQKQFKVILFLASGFVFFSILGSFYHRNLLWAVNQLIAPVFKQQNHSSDLTLWHFIGHFREMTGLPLLLMFVTGCYLVSRAWLSGEKSQRAKAAPSAILLLFPFIVYLSFRSFLAWNNQGDATTDIRIMTTVLPVAGLIALIGYEHLEKMLSGFLAPHDDSNIRLVLFRILIIAIVCYTAFTVNRFPVQRLPLENTIGEIVSWLKTSAYSGKRVYSTNYSVLEFMDADPYDTVNGSCFKLINCQDLKSIRPGSVVIWDGLTGGTSAIPEDTLLNSPNLKLVNYITSPKDPVRGIDTSFECLVMTSFKRSYPVNNYSIRDSLLDVNESGTSLKQLISLGFEEGGGTSDTLTYSSTIRHNGKFSFKMDENREFSPGLCASVRVVPDSLNRQQIRVTAYIYTASPWKGTNTFLVITLENKGQSYFYPNQNLTQQKLMLNRWNKMVLSAQLPEIKSQNDVLKVYIWNPNKEVFFMDDLRVDIIRN